MDIKSLLQKTEYEDSADCIATYITGARIRSAQALDELPGRVGHKICGHNTYTLVARLKDRLAEAEEEDNEFRQSLGDDEAYHALVDAGFTDSAQVAVLSDEQLEAVPGIGKTRRARIRKVTGGPPTMPAEESK